MDDAAAQSEKPRTVMISVGDPSGDVHAAKLIRAMRIKHHGLDFHGIGGVAMRHEGVRLIADSSQLSVVGITEALPKLRGLLNALKDAKNLLKRLRPDLLILIDFPDFNLHLAAGAKKIGVPVLYYITPQVWAWRAGRIKKIRQRIDHAAVILPFEETLFRAHNIPVTFVGHPLLDIEKTAEAVRQKQTPVSASPVVGLLPGSRDGEVTRHLPVMLEAARLIGRRMEHVKFIVSVASSVGKNFACAIIERFGHGINLETVTCPAEDVFGRCTMVIAASGTVTLEAAIHGVPMIIIYRVSPVSYLLGRALIRVPHISLANLIAGKQIVPELIQHEASPENIADVTCGMLADTDRLQRIRNELFQVTDALGGAGASKRTAAVAVDMLNSR
ncbi:MAG: lipid-A-disaccharide synthase [Desulfobacterales bacterium]|nr:lipid-A-disaccharide synthase [Desulfobacterales bacterium]MDD4071178.1 lipid-A-disaccharide synthase [Desulfobacterales bacterium]MDD4392186.1 lipid-A-disaccharide synthase [Desulfobacterales bacterium]